MRQSHMHPFPIYKAVGSRTNKAEAVLANLEYCEDNDKDWDPAAKYGKKTGPASMATSSPGAPARAQKAMKKSCGVREGLANYNEQAEKDGGTVLGEHNKRTFVELAGTGPEGAGWTDGIG